MAFTVPVYDIIIISGSRQPQLTGVESNEVLYTLLRVMTHLI